MCAAHVLLCSAGTFHSIGCQIVRRHVEHLGDTGRQGFNIFDQDDTKAVMKKALKQHFSQRRGTIASSNIEDDDSLEDAVADQTQLQEWVSLVIVLFCSASVAHPSTKAVQTVHPISHWDVGTSHYLCDTCLVGCSLHTVTCTTLQNRRLCCASAMDNEYQTAFLQQTQ